MRKQQQSFPMPASHKRLCNVFHRVPLWCGAEGANSSAWSDFFSGGIEGTERTTLLGSRRKRTGFLFSTCGCRAPALIDAVSQGNNRTSRKNAVQRRQAQARRGPLRPKNKTERQCNRRAAAAVLPAGGLCRTAHLNPF